MTNHGNVNHQDNILNNADPTTMALINKMLEKNSYNNTGNFALS